jgi:hypothetical protein
MVNLPGRKGSTAVREKEALEVAAERAFPKAKSDMVFGQPSRSLTGSGDQR